MAGAVAERGGFSSMASNRAGAVGGAVPAARTGGHVYARRMAGFACWRLAGEGRWRFDLC